MKKILVVDDEPLIHNVLKEILARDGYKATSAYSAGEARQALKDRPFDLIICDIIMPGESGLDFIRSVTIEYPDLPIIMLTAVDDFEAARVALQEGVYAYLIKPFETKQLLISITNALLRHNNERKKSVYRENLERNIEDKQSEIQCKDEKLKKIQTDLQESENNFRHALQSSGDGVTMVHDGVHVYVNDKFLEIFGYDRPEEIVGQSLALIIHPEERERILSLQKKRQEGETDRFRFTHKGLRKDGKVIYLDISASRSQFNGKAVTLAFVRDITDKKKAEDLLRQSEEKFQAISESAQDAIIMMDQKGIVSYWNRAAQNVFGYSRDEIIGHNLHNLLAPDRFRAGHLHAFKAFQETGTGNAIGNTIELTALKKDGSEFPVELSTSAVKINGAWHAVGIVRDLSERKAVENSLFKKTRDLEETKEKLLNSHQELENLFSKVEKAKVQWESTMDCLGEMVVLVDRNGEVQRCNRAFKKFIGLPYPDIVGRPFRDIFPDAKLPKDLQAHQRSEYHCEKSDKWFLKNVSPYKDPNGQSDAGFIITFSETTTLKQITHELENKNHQLDRNRENLQRALDEISNLIQKVVAIKDFGVRFNNPNLAVCHEEMGCNKPDCPGYGIGPVRCWQLAGTFCGDEVQGDFAEKLDTCMDCIVMKASCEDPFCQIGEHFNNMMHILETKNRELQDAYVKLKKTQARIIQQEKMASIGQLAAGVAHEINNPTGFISSNLKTLSDYQKDLFSMMEGYEHLLGILSRTCDSGDNAGEIPQEIKRIRALGTDLDIAYLRQDIPNLINESREGTERIKKIVLDLKDFAHPGKHEKEYADINKNLDSTLNIVWNELKYKATVTKEYGDIPEVLCYPQQLNQVFMNILVNAAQAIEREGEITIKTLANNGSVEVRISDTGKGISREILPKIFDPFFTTKEVGKGTGLGLNMAYNIVKKHNGEITVDSAQGRGTTFTVNIPIESHGGETDESRVTAG